jgi:hypothetical protein
MTPNPDQPAPDSGLQFDRADFAGGQALKCSACSVAISGDYYQVNDQVVCPACSEKFAAYGSGGGSKAGRFLRATAAGIGGGFAGFLIYWGVLELTNINFGLIAIVVGWLVGNGVRWGSDRLGGKFYQLLALAITYVAICSTYIPLILRASDAPDVTMPFVVKFIVAFIFSMAAPWLEGPSNIIGWIIIGFGLYQAWIMNRKIPIQITGPFSTGQATPPAAALNP